jgi:hypothetical protein
MASSSCSECGALLRVATDRCPLCGKQADGDRPRPKEDVDDYQLRVRKLREELKKLREDGAEAV